MSKNKKQIKTALMQTVEKRKGVSKHAVPHCDNVTRPTFIYRPEDEHEVYLQWRGTSYGIDFGEQQFLFPVGILDVGEAFMFHPEKFEVCIIEKISDWSDAVQMNKNKLMDKYKDEDMTLIGYISSEYSSQVEHTKPAGPLCGCAPITRLHDSQWGIIAPESFFEMSVEILATERFKNRSTDKSSLN